LKYANEGNLQIIYGRILSITWKEKLDIFRMTGN